MFLRLRLRGFTLLELILSVALGLVFFFLLASFWPEKSKADEGREPGDPRIIATRGSFTGGMPHIASPAIHNQTGVVIARPSRTDDGTVGQFTDWQWLHLFRIDSAMAAIFENLHFEFDSSQVEEQYSKELDEVAKLLIANPEVSIALGGHTDLVGSEDYNHALASRRAAAVLASLSSRGVPSDRLFPISLGESDPIIQVLTPERRNRRVEFYLAAETPIYLP